MTELPDIIVDRDDDILHVTINRPAQHNAISRDVLATLLELFTLHRDNMTLRGAVLRGAGDHSFAAGGDLRDLGQVRTRPDAVRMADEAKRALNAIRAFPVPVIAALNGDALGGGAELAMACDMRLAAAHARIGFVQGRLNISTGWGGGIDLMRVLDPVRGLEVLCRSELIEPEDALRMGLFNTVAAPGQTIETLIAETLVYIRQQEPQVLRAFKTLSHGVRMGLPRDQLEALETRMFATTWTHPDHWEAADRVLDPARKRKPKA